MSRYTISSSAIDGQPGSPNVGAALALVHDGTLGEPLHLAVLRQHDAEVGGVLERTTHQQRVLDAVAVVGEQVDTGRGQLGQRRELLARPDRS